MTNSNPDKGKLIGGICPECGGETVMFTGMSLDTQYKICSRYKEIGHKNEEEIRARIERVQRIIRPSGRMA